MSAVRTAMVGVAAWIALGPQPLATAAPFNAALAGVHVHLTPDYIGGWTMGLYDFDNGRAYDPNTTILYVPPLDRTTQPSGSQWNFIGAGTGGTYWRTPQTPSGNTLSLSVATEETIFGTFTSYVDTDPRLPQISLPWMKMTLSGMRGPGQFALWQQSGTSAPAPWIASADGLSAADNATLPEGGHVHYFSGFTAPGFYELDFQGSGRIGGSTSTSATQTYYVAVAPPVVAASLSNSRLVDFIDPGLDHVLADASDGLFTPLAAAYDARANIYLADVLRSRVLKIDLQGNTSVLADAGDGLTSPSGLVAAPNGDLFVSNYLSDTVLRIDSAGNATLFADASDGVDSPFGLALDRAGNLFVADLNHSRVLKFSTAGVASVFADAADGLLSPLGVAVSPAGDVYVADALRSRIMKFNAAGVGSIFADSGDGLAAPSGVSCDLLGNVYVADYLAHNVLKFTPAGVGSVFGSAGDGLNSPFGLAAYNPPLGPAPALAAVPEPATGWLAALGGLIAVWWRVGRRGGAGVGRPFLGRAGPALGNQQATAAKGDCEDGPGRKECWNWTLLWPTICVRLRRRRGCQAPAPA